MSQAVTTVYAVIDGDQEARSAVLAIVGDVVTARQETTRLRDAGIADAYWQVWVVDDLHYVDIAIDPSRPDTQ